MGGFGSGRYGFTSAGTCESRHSIDLAWLRRRGIVKKGWIGGRTTLTWSRGGEKTGSIGVLVQTGGLRLTYVVLERQQDLHAAGRHSVPRFSTRHMKPVLTDPGHAAVRQPDVGSGFVRMSPEWPGRLAFAVLVVLPFVRVIAISVPALASTREFVEAALQAALRRGFGFNVNVAVGWLVVSYLALSVGWTRTTSRLLLAFGVTLIFAVLPLFILFRPVGNHDRPGQLFNFIGLWPVCSIPIGVLAFLLYVIVILAIRDFASGR